jgi:hypothetical protein
MTVNKRSVSMGLGNNNWAAEIDVAVFFNRAFSSNDETLHTVAVYSPTAGAYAGKSVGMDQQPGVANVDDDDNGAVDDPSEIGWLGSDDNRTITVALASKPSLKKGGFMLDPTRLKWYRILNLPDIAAGSPVTLLLDHDYAPDAAAPAALLGKGVFMKGVVEVYSLGARTGQQ